MNRITRSGIPLAALIVLASAQTAQAQRQRAGKPKVPKTVSVANSSVMEWFSQTHPHAGQTDTVYAQAWIRNKPWRGARLQATVAQGKHVLLRVRGSSTGRSGRAQARFRIPRSARHTSLTVKVTLVSGRRAIYGLNRLVVQ